MQFLLQTFVFIAFIKCLGGNKWFFVQPVVNSTVLTISQLKLYKWPSLIFFLSIVAFQRVNVPFQTTSSLWNQAPLHQNKFLTSKWRQLKQRLAANQKMRAATKTMWFQRLRKNVLTLMDTRKSFQIAPIYTTTNNQRAKKWLPQAAPFAKTFWNR